MAPACRVRSTAAFSRNVATRFRSLRAGRARRSYSEAVSFFEALLATGTCEFADPSSSTGSSPTIVASTIPLIAFMHNHAGGSQSLASRIGRDGVVRYALIAEQPTMISTLPRFDSGPLGCGDMLCLSARFPALCGSAVATLPRSSARATEYPTSSARFARALEPWMPFVSHPPPSPYERFFIGYRRRLQSRIGDDI